MEKGVDSYFQHSSALTITELTKLYREKKLSPVEVVTDMLDKIERSQESLNAYVTVAQETALASAKQAEQRLLKGDTAGQQLLGIPLGIKDVIYTKDLPTTMGCEIFRDFTPDFDATVVAKLKAAGGVLLGKTNAHQFAFGATGDKSHVGPPRNPYHPRKMTGGSSGGSGAAVSANLCAASLGTDTGGSIRIPAACCGIVGLKPTYGRVSKYGVYPLSHTFDHVGPMTKSVADNALLLQELAGFDAQDKASVKREWEDYTRRLQEGVKGTTIGIPTQLVEEIVDEEVRTCFDDAVKVYSSLGAKMTYIPIPDMAEWRKARRTVQMCEAFAVNEQHMKRHPDLVDDEIKQRFLPFTYSAADYRQAIGEIPKAQAFFLKMMEGTEVLLLPALPVLPPDLYQREVEINAKKYGCVDLLTQFMWQANMTGFPALCTPCGFSKEGMPIGIQLMGRPFDEANLYRFGNALEKALGLR